MDNLDDPRISAYKPQRRLLLPMPPGYRRKLNKAQRHQRALAEERADERATRLHLVGLTNTAVIVMGVIAVAAVLMLMMVMIIRV